MSKRKILSFLFLSSALAIIFAYISQFIFGYQPCILCLYQRIPFFAIIALTLLALFFFKKESLKQIIIIACIALLTSNAGIASYHVGVEQKIFKGFSKCSSQNLNIVNNIEELKAALLNEKLSRCDEPEFFFLTLSMAAWNLIYCTLLTFLTIFFLFFSKKQNLRI